MPLPSPRAIRFVRALVGGAIVHAQGNLLVAVCPDGRKATILITKAAELQSAGVLLGNSERCSAGTGARSWLKRAIVESDGFAAQHRIEARTAEGTRLNLAESPLSRLAVPPPQGGPAFLARHQLEAGERVRRLAQRAWLQPRTIMSYDPAHTASGGGPGATAELSDMAAEARRSLAELHRVLPADCAGVVLDVCGLEKGLQAVESERGWPRRSAKLVLRIGLDHLARHFGFAPEAVGPRSAGNRT